MTFDETTIRTWWDVMKRGKDLVEIRLLGQRTGSGYFKDCESLLMALRTAPDGYGCYFTLNAIADGAYGRKQHEQILFDKGITTTSDRDIIGRNWILIDLDPNRPSGCNSTDEELVHAKTKANEIFVFLRQQGFPDPVVAVSGNGTHLYVPVALRNDDATTTLVKEFLQTLDMLFSDDVVSVDVSCSNAARIAKLPSTISPKGANTVERPQRASYFQRIPENIGITERAYIEKVAALLPKPDVATRHNDYDPGSFDIDNFIKEHDIKVAREVVTSSHRKIILDCCPFDSSHRAPDSALFVMPNGAIGFRCLHAHCAHYTFKDFRLHYDPLAYSKTDYFEHKQKLDYYAPRRKVFVPMEETKENGPKWLQMSDIKYQSQADTPSVPTGYPELDAKMGNLLMGDVTILTGRNASGKSIILNTIALNMVTRGCKVAVWSAELQPARYLSWLCQVAAGKAYVKKAEGFENYWYCPKVYAEKIAKWLDGKLWLYASEKYNSGWMQLECDLKGAVKLKGINVAIIDNLSAMDLSEVEGDAYEKQKTFITSAKNLAKSLGIHIIIVVHPRKTTQFLRKEDVGGSFAITNLCDNLLLVHRCNKDFEIRAGEFFKKAEVEKMMGYDTVVELGKCRATGAEDALVGLFYEPETKRLKNSVAESIVYPWQEDTPALPENVPPPDPDPYVDLFETSDEPPF